MRLFKFVLAGALFAATTANAQVATPSLLMPSSAATALAAASATAAPDPAMATLASKPAPAAKAQGGVIGVFENYNFQASVGYTFVRFYQAPHQIQSRNGFNSNMVYYYRGGWFGADGTLLGSFGSQFGQRSRFVFAGGGPRFRWAGRRAVEFWGHVLVGGSHYTPQTAFGSQGAFGYEMGGGVDANAHHRRLAYRLELDMIGTRYFGTYQYSPMASVAVVWKF